MKKESAALVLSIFLLSVIVSAHEDGEKAPLLKRLDQFKQHEIRALKSVEKRFERALEKLPDENLKKLAALPRSFLKKLDPSLLDAALDKIKIISLKKDEMHRLFLKRSAEIGENRAAFKAKITESRSRFSENKAGFEKAKSDFLSNHGSENLKSALLKSADLVTAHLENLKANAGAALYISDEEADNMTKQIDFYLSDVSSLKTKIELASTKDELKDFAKEIYGVWRSAKLDSNFHETRLHMSKSMEILKRAGQLERRFARLINLIEDMNINVAGLQAEQNKFSQKLSEARSFLNQSETFFLQAKSVNFDPADITTEAGKRAEIKNLLNQSIQASRQAHIKLKEAHNILKNLANQMIPTLRYPASGKIERPELAPKIRPILDNIEIKKILDPEKPIEGVETESGSDIIEVAVEEES